jgi:ribosomal protein L19E
VEKSVVRADLRRLVEDDQVERQVRVVEIRAHRQRAHHQARLEARQEGRYLRQQVAERQVAALLVHLAEQDAEF